VNLENGDKPYLAEPCNDLILWFKLYQSLKTSTGNLNAPLKSIICVCMFLLYSSLTICIDISVGVAKNKTSTSKLFSTRVSRQ
jgi:hypothetical protein